MRHYRESPVERAMKVQEVLLRVIDGQLSWARAGEILGLCPPQVRRLRQRFEDVATKRYSTGDASRARSACRWRRCRRCCNCIGSSMRTATCSIFHELVRERHGLTLSYSCVKGALRDGGARGRWAVVAGRIGGCESGGRFPLARHSALAHRHQGASLPFRAPPRRGPRTHGRRLSITHGTHVIRRFATDGHPWWARSRRNADMLRTT